MYNEDDRRILTLSDNSTLFMTLPITFPLQGILHTSARLYSDGLINFPDQATVTPLPSRCLGNQNLSVQTIFGWWADLDPGAPEARVSSFLVSSGKFV